jgi:hypothetical protein
MTTAVSRAAACRITARPGGVGSGGGAGGVNEHAGKRATASAAKVKRA